MALHKCSKDRKTTIEGYTLPASNLIRRSFIFKAMSSSREIVPSPMSITLTSRQHNVFLLNDQIGHLCERNVKCVIALGVPKIALFVSFRFMLELMIAVKLRGLIRSSSAINQQALPAGIKTVIAHPAAFNKGLKKMERTERPFSSSFISSSLHTFTFFSFIISSGTLTTSF